MCVFFWSLRQVGFNQTLLSSLCTSGRNPAVYIPVNVGLDTAQPPPSSFTLLTSLSELHFLSAYLNKCKQINGFLLFTLLFIETETIVNSSVLGSGRVYKSSAISFAPHHSLLVRASSERTSQGRESGIQETGVMLQAELFSRTVG